MPIVRDVRIPFTEESKVLSSEGRLGPEMAGQHAYLAGTWGPIHRVKDANTAHSDMPMQKTGTESVPVVLMNDIRIRGESIALTRFEIVYAPCVW